MEVFDRMPDPFLRAVDSAKRFVDGVRPDQWSNATPCTEWDMRVLVNHITSEAFWVKPLLEGRTIAEVGGRLDGDLVGDDPTATFDRGAEEALAAAVAPAAMEGVAHISTGDTPKPEYLGQIFLDMLIHGWDVAKGSGQDPTLDPELVELCIPLAEEAIRQINAAIGPGVIFADGVQASDASRQAHLLAVLGRSADWAPPAPQP